MVDENLTFEYSEDFRRRIVRLHRGKESWPNYSGYIRDHLGGPESRLVWFAAKLCPEIEYRCGSLAEKRVLDFGCGTGSATVPLAESAAAVSGFDIDSESVDICRQRVEEHGLGSRVTLHCASDLRAASTDLGTFDLILLSGVLEHVPRSLHGLRRDILRALVGMLRPGGHLYIHDTPNRLWPYDFHSTQLWWVPWFAPGSERAYRLAVRKGRHSPAPTISDGPLGLEEAGAWGCTYWEVRKCVDGTGCTCTNLEDGLDARIWYSRTPGLKRKVFERLMHWPSVRLLRAPVTAFSPFLTNLVFEKPELPFLSMAEGARRGAS